MKTNSRPGGLTSLILRILIRFFTVYVLLFLLYQCTLSFSRPDIFTLWTGKQTAWLMKIFTPHVTFQIVSPTETGIFLNDRWIVKIVEGCNGMSILILFWALIWAFPSSWKDKLFYSITGGILIWLANLFRIALLGWVYYKYPGFFDMAHRVLFPAIIYGTVIVLWMYWAHKTAKGNRIKKPT